MGERPDVKDRVPRTCDPNVVHFLDGRNVHTYVRAVSTQDKRGPDNFAECGRRRRGTPEKGVPSVQPRMRFRGPVGPTSP